jgi:oligoendopeptidase F
MLSEAAGLAMVAYTRDTTDPTLEAAHLRFSGEIGPRSEEQEVVLAQRLIESGFTRPDLEVTIRKFRTRIAIFREANVPIMKEVEELDAKYQKLTGGLTVKWDGIEKTIPELQPFLQSPERRVRERAFRQGAQAYIDRRTELAALFDQLFLLRRRIAANAGFANFEDYSFQSKFRFDYTPADCRRFHEAVEEVVMPAIARMLERRRLRLGLTRLRPWDLGQDPEGREALRPFQSAEELVNGAARVFGQVSPDCGSEFRVMIGEGLLDLETRKG